MGIKGFVIQFNLDGKPQVYLPSCRVARADVETELANLRVQAAQTKVHWFKAATDMQIVPMTIVVDA